MKIVITENQLKYVLEQQTDELCISDYVDMVNSHLGGIVQLTDDEVYSAYEDPSVLLNDIQDPKMKTTFQKILNGISQMSLEQQGAELKNLLGTLKNVQEQQTPYLDQNMVIGGTEVPKVLVHTLGGLVVITLLSKIINTLGKRMDGVKPSRRSGSKYIVGCQGARSRAKAVRKRRRRENWRSFLRKIGLR